MSKSETNPEIVFSVPHEKFIFRVGNEWAITTPVGPSGAFVHLVSRGWPAVQAKTLVKNPDLATAVHVADVRPNSPPIFFDGQTGQQGLNLWVPPTLVPKAGPFPSIEIALENVTRGDSEGRQWFEQWMALKVQNPDVVPKVAVVFATLPGAGKGFMARVMSEILGPKNCAIVKQHELENRFNSRWVRKLFVLGDEVLSNENVKDISQLLKVLVDGGELEYEQKHANQVAVKSRLAWMFASNDPISPVMLENADRRYTFFSNFDSVTEEFKTLLSACFEADRVTPTAAFLEEIAGFAAHLHSVKVDRGFVARPYENDARKALMAANKPSAEAFFEAVAERGIDVYLESADMRRNSGWRGDSKEWDFGDAGVTFERVYAAYAEFCKQNGMGALRSTKFSHALANHRPTVEKTRPLAPSGARPTVYAVRRSPKPPPKTEVKRE